MTKSISQLTSYLPAWISRVSGALTVRLKYSPLTCKGAFTDSPDSSSAVSIHNAYGNILRLCRLKWDISYVFKRVRIVPAHQKDGEETFVYHEMSFCACPFCQSFPPKNQPLTMYPLTTITLPEKRALIFFRIKGKLTRIFLKSKKIVQSEHPANEKSLSLPPC